MTPTTASMGHQSRLGTISEVSYGVTPGAVSEPFVFVSESITKKGVIVERAGLRGTRSHVPIRYPSGTLHGRRPTGARAHARGPGRLVAPHPGCAGRGQPADLRPGRDAAQLHAFDRPRGQGLHLCRLQGQPGRAARRAGGPAAVDPGYRGQERVGGGGRQLSVAHRGRDPALYLFRPGSDAGQHVARGQAVRSVDRQRI